MQSGPRPPHVVPTSPHALPGEDAALLAALHADVAARIRRVCADLSPEDFDALVRDICAVKLRWDVELREGRSDGELRRRATRGPGTP